MKAIFWCLWSLSLMWLLSAALFRPLGASSPKHSSPEKKDIYRSPADLVLLPGGQQVLTANQAANTVSLVDLHQGKVLAEIPCGVKPVALACTANGKLAAVSNLWSA